MSTKVALLAAALIIIFARVISSDENVLAGNKKPLYDGYVFINETKYYINTMVGDSRDEAKVLCETVRMNLVAFDSKEKWDMINSWLLANEYTDALFWTDGLKDEDSTTWYWETTGAEIAEFFWGVNQPDYDNPFPGRMCFQFLIHPKNIGWYDDLCEFGSNDVICE